MNTLQVINWLKVIKELNPKNTELNEIIKRFKKKLKASKPEYLTKIACPFLSEIIELELQMRKASQGREKINYPGRETAGRVFEKLNPPSKMSEAQINAIKTMPIKKRNEYSKEIGLIIIAWMVSNFLNDKLDQSASSTLKMVFHAILPAAIVIASVSVFFKSYSGQKTNDIEFNEPMPKQPRAG